MDVVTGFQHSLAGFTDQVDRAQSDQWDAPTPCADWDVRTLVNHVVAETYWVPPLMAGATMEEVGDRYDGDVLGSMPTAAADRAAALARSAVMEPGAMDTTVHLSFGDTSSEEYLRQMMTDQLIHSWDLAMAIGEDPNMDPEVVAMVSRWFGDHEQQYRDSGAIGPREPVSSDASQQDRLLGAFGRDPNWSPGR